MFDKLRRPLFSMPVSNRHFDLSIGHICWKTNFRNAIANHELLDVATIAKDDCCELGRWLHDSKIRQRLNHQKSYHDCLEKHAEFHLEAGKIAELANAGNYYDALQLFNGTSEFSRTFMYLVLCISNLEEYINDEPGDVNDFYLTPVLAY